MGRYIIILNRFAGKCRAPYLSRALDVLKHGGADVEVYESAYQGNSTVLAADAAAQHPQMIVAAGGDGTVNEVLNGVAGKGVPMGILPVGSANVLALEIGVPPDPAGASQVLLGMHTVPVCIGKAGDRFFMLMAGVGFDACVIENLNLRTKRLVGKLAYVTAGLQTLNSFSRSGMLTIDIDELPSMHACSAVVCNARHYAGPFQIAPRATLRNPQLEICMFKGRNRCDVLRYALGIARGRHSFYDDVDIVTGRRVRITSEPGHEAFVQADGDLVGKLPMEFSAVENALLLAVPAAAAGQLMQR